MKARFVDVAHQYRSSKPLYNSLLKTRHINALKELKNNPNIVILRPDKGSGAVVMDVSDYNAKMSDILNDHTKFIVVDKPQDITDIEKTVDKMLKEFKKKQLITNELYEQLKPKGTSIPHLYGLPKVHKPGYPLRPILSMLNSPHHPLAKWLVTLLEPVKNDLCKFTLKDSF